MHCTTTWNGLELVVFVLPLALAYSKRQVFLRTIAGNKNNKYQEISSTDDTHVMHYWRTRISQQSYALMPQEEKLSMTKKRETRWRDERKSNSLYQKADTDLSYDNSGSLVKIGV